MIVDSSAIVAILAGESDAQEMLHALRQAPSRYLSASTYLEVSVVLDRRPLPANRDLDSLLAQLDITIVPFTPAQARIAREAHRRHGRGSGHPAWLNFGDCFAYALARERGLPLLLKGDDFARTDVVPAR